MTTTRQSSSLGEWITVVGWCPLCWWREAVEFHRSASSEKIQKRIKELHGLAKPDCHEKTRVSFGDSQDFKSHG